MADHEGLSCQQFPSAGAAPTPADEVVKSYRNALRDQVRSSLQALGRTCAEVRAFFRRNPEVLAGEPWEDPVARYLHNVLGVNPVVGVHAVRCGPGVRVPVPAGARAFLDWYDDAAFEPELAPSTGKEASS